MYKKTYQAATILRKKKRRPFPKELIEEVNAGEDLFTALSYQRIKELNQKVKYKDKQKRYGQAARKVPILDNLLDQSESTNDLEDSFDALLRDPRDSANKPNDTKRKQIRPIKEKKKCILNLDSSYLHLLEESYDVDMLVNKFTANRDKLRRSKEEKKHFKTVQENTSSESVSEEALFSKNTPAGKNASDCDCGQLVNEKWYNERKKQYTKLESSTPAKYVTNEPPCLLSPIIPVKTQISVKCKQKEEECDESVKRQGKNKVKELDLIQLCFELSLDSEQNGSKSNLKSQECVIEQITTDVTSASIWRSNPTKQVELNTSNNNLETLNHSEENEVMTLSHCVVHSLDPFAESVGIDEHFKMSYTENENLANTDIRKIPFALERSQETLPIVNNVNEKIDSSACSSMLHETKQYRKKCDKLYQNRSSFEENSVAFSIIPNTLDDNSVQLNKATHSLRNIGYRKCHKSLCLDSQTPEDKSNIIAEVNYSSEISDLNEISDTRDLNEVSDTSESSEKTTLSEILETSKASTLSSSSFTSPRCVISLCVDSQKPEDKSNVITETSDSSEISETNEISDTRDLNEVSDTSESSEKTTLSEVLETSKAGTLSSSSFRSPRCDKSLCLSSQKNKNKSNTVVEHSSSDISKMKESNMLLSNRSTNEKVLNTRRNNSESIKTCTSVTGHSEELATILMSVKPSDSKRVDRKSFAARKSHLVVSLFKCEFNDCQRSLGFREVYFGSPTRKELTNRNSTPSPAAARNSTLCPSINRNCSVLQEESILDDELTFKDLILEHCKQTEVLAFDEAFPDSDLEDCKKIGEGVYGEVFSRRTVEGRHTVMKIMPIEGNCQINGETQKTYEEILPEIVITGQLSKLRESDYFCTANFPELIHCWCVQGTYPSRFLDLWHEYDKEKTSENDSPEILPKDQIYIILELNNVGTALEGFTFNSAEQAWSAFMQVTYTLAVAEAALEFEHRDLHWGNILIQRTKDKTIACKIYGEDQDVHSHGIQASVIDFTLSRITYDGCCIYNNLAEDPALFEGVGDYQFDIYRKMRDQTENKWQVFQPYNNVLWLSYVLEKLIKEVNYRNKKSKVHRNGMSKLNRLEEKILDFKTATEVAIHLSS